MPRNRRSNAEQQLIDDNILGILAQLCKVQSKPEVLSLYNQNQKNFNRSINWRLLDEAIGQKSHPTKSYSYRRFHDIIAPNSLPNFPVETQEQINNFVSRKFAAEFKADWSKGEMDAYRLALKNQAVKDFKLKENALIYNYYSEVSRINHKIVRLIEGLTEGSKQKLKKTKSSPQSQNQQHSRVVGSFSSQQSYSFDSFGQNQECSSLIKVSDQSTQYTTYIFKGCPLEPFDQIW
ncbi:Hypothetical_protein [Hexamita inflata]|uniref:Hypothetical_protein n=1 Tax=Hexamita inflata TaxID=28002 RepID=A0AA86QLG5_9EUKA|nr:Hypothetical protein HINF_LOCUS44138 [Hexamita inflata]